MNARLHPAGWAPAALILLALTLTGCESAPVQSAAAQPPSAPDPVASATQCMPVAAFQAMARERQILIAEVKPVGPFLAALNEMPPQTDLEADQILVVHTGRSAQLLLAQGGCMRATVEIGWEDFLRFAGQRA